MNIGTLAANLSPAYDGDLSGTNQNVSLDAMLSAALDKCNETAESAKLKIESQFSVKNATDPKSLIALQTEVQNYSIYVSLVGTLARKGISTVETVVKGQ
jgi:hypothetical protein